jgi:TRAP-type mannitol/chloroaromatic compound transport system permease small subunit
MFLLAPSLFNLKRQSIMSIHNSYSLVKLAGLFEKIVNFSAHIFCWAYPILIFAIIANVVLRYGFSNGLIVFEEIQWHLFAIGMLFGLSYAEVTNSQVRVDVLADKLKKRAVYKWEIFGAIIFTIPFLLVIIYNSFDYVADSYSVGETSNSPLGLPFRWAIKAVIPISFLLLLIAVISRLLRNIDALINKKEISNGN